MFTLTTFPWTSILSFLITFLFSKASGRSTKSALLTGAAVGAATWFLADPSNPDNLLKIGQADADPSTVPGGNTSGNPMSTPEVIGKVSSQVIDTTGKVLTSWGAAGTAGVIAAATIDKKWWPWILGAVGLVLLSQ